MHRLVRRDQTRTGSFCSLNPHHWLIGEDGDHFLKWRIQPMTLLVNGKFNVNNHAHLVVGSNNLTQWFYYYFSQKDLAVHLTRQGAGRFKLTKSSLINIPCAIPPLPEQRAIAAALSDVDALISAQNKLIAKKRDLKQAATQQLLTGKKRLPGFSEEWREGVLRNFVYDFIVPMRDKPKRFTGQIPWCRIEDFDGKYLTASKSGQHVDEQTIREMNLKVYPKDTLLVSCSADLGRCSIVGNPLVSNQTFIGLVMDQEHSSIEFFYYYMTSKAEELNNLSSGTTISYLSREQFESFTVFVPTDKNEQAAIATVLSDIDAEIAALEQQRGKTRNLKQGMMQELLTGRTRLV